MDYRKTIAENLITEDKRKSVQMLIYYYFEINTSLEVFTKCDNKDYCVEEDAMMRLATYKALVGFNPNIDEVLQILEMSTEEFNQFYCYS